jgi:hypothetical protein
VTKKYTPPLPLAYYAVLCTTSPKPRTGGKWPARKEFCNLGTGLGEVCHTTSDRGWAEYVMRGLARRYPDCKYELMVVKPAVEQP